MVSPSASMVVLFHVPDPLVLKVPGVVDGTTTSVEQVRKQLDKVIDVVYGFVIDQPLWEDR